MTENNLLIEGKTKQVFYDENDPTGVVVVSKDDITAGDGAQHDVISGKSIAATTTTCNVFRLLGQCGIKTAFREQTSERTFAADLTEMIKLEVVARREAKGSYRKRNPHLPDGHVFPQLVIEFFLKTKDRVWREHALPVDDPLILIEQLEGEVNNLHLLKPSEPLYSQTSFLSIDPQEVFPQGTGCHYYYLLEIEKMTRQVFLILEQAFHQQGGRLYDFKIEFGFNQTGDLVVSDVIDNDSWRVAFNGLDVSKESYRQGDVLPLVKRNYAEVAAITERFALPQQQVVIWTGSQRDDIDPLLEVLKPYLNYNDLKVICHARSLHKEPARGYQELHQLVQGSYGGGTTVLDTVVIAYIGMSNGAGPTLAANTHVPVITCSPSVQTNREDIASSTRLPSKVPLPFVESPANAVLSALRILAMRNPRLAALLRADIEERLTNLVAV